MNQLNPKDNKYTSPSSNQQRRKSKMSRVGKMILFISASIIAAISLSIFLITAAVDIFSFGKQSREIEIIVESGMTNSDIASLLKKEGVINQSSTYTLYSTLRNKDGPVETGDYVLNSNMSYDQIILVLTSNNSIKEEVRITFQEGMSAVDIANRLEDEGVCDADEFLDNIEVQEFGYEFEDMISENELRFRKLEGYLFPDTYDFYKNEDITSVIKKFLRNFQNRVFPELYDEILSSGMTLDDAIILASVIQKEASFEEDMKHVSSVFHNRMNNPEAGLPKLQSDVTILYVEDDIKLYQERTTQDIYDAYNTYETEGLPVGAICSPGLAAIRATINPDETADYFFVTDINGKFYYSKTHDEHIANVALAESVE